MRSGGSSLGSARETTSSSGVKKPIATRFAHQRPPHDEHRDLAEADVLQRIRVEEDEERARREECERERPACVLRRVKERLERRTYGRRRKVRPPPCTVPGALVRVTAKELPSAPSVEGCAIAWPERLIIATAVAPRALRLCVLPSRTAPPPVK